MICLSCLLAYDDLGTYLDHEKSEGIRVTKLLLSIFYHNNFLREDGLWSTCCNYALPQACALKLERLHSQN
jgi:hypothetical protein